MAKLKIAVLADGDQVQKFALMALDAIQDCDEITVFSCTNTFVRRDLTRNAAYYALNLLSVRNPLTALVSLALTRKRIARTVRFESDYQGVWQALPRSVIDDINQSKFDLVIKLGMYLLKVPRPDELATPILSFHHGDPDHYRGRPAGFWEIVHGSPTIGQIVQVISNKLDAGKVVAFGETRVLPYSYRTTLMNAYAHSPLLINTAIRNALGGVHLAKACMGKNCRLPSNFTVAKFISMMAFRFLRRMLYGAFFEKSWKVSTATLNALRLQDVTAGTSFPEQKQWRTFAVAKDYTFYADPFFSSDPPGVLVEALNRRTSLGEIVLLDGDRHIPLGVAPGHLSYPFTFETAGRQFVLPEAASWSPPHVYSIEGGSMAPVRRLHVEQETRVVDPTLLQHEGRFYLFGNDRRVGSNALFLWSADSLDSEFALHPMSPVLVSPRGARMGGAFCNLDGRLVRFGQSFVGDYGDGLFAFEVEELSAAGFSESLIGELKFEGCKGPHTLNIRGSEVAFDWYRDRFSLLAAPRRLLARRRARALAAGNAGSGPVRKQPAGAGSHALQLRLSAKAKPLEV